MNGPLPKSNRVPLASLLSFVLLLLLNKSVHSRDLTEDMRLIANASYDVVEEVAGSVLEYGSTAVKKSATTGQLMGASAKLISKACSKTSNLSEGLSASLHKYTIHQKAPKTLPNRILHY